MEMEHTKKLMRIKNKYKDVEVEIVKKVYEEEMLKEINEDRIKHGKKPLENIEKTEIMYDEETGEIKENINTKHIKKSITDTESGCFHKGEKEKCFAYTHQTFCDKNGFVLASITTPGNVHDIAKGVTREAESFGYAEVSSYLKASKKS